MSEVLTEILKLHRRVVVITAYGDRAVCDHCSTGDPYCTVSDEWPCPTVAIILKADGVSTVSTSG